MATASESQAIRSGEQQGLTKTENPVIQFVAKGAQRLGEALHIRRKTESANSLVHQIAEDPQSISTEISDRFIEKALETEIPDASAGQTPNVVAEGIAGISTNPQEVPPGGTFTTPESRAAVRNADAKYGERFNQLRDAAEVRTNRDAAHETKIQEATKVSQDAASAKRTPEQIQQEKEALQGFANNTKRENDQLQELADDVDPGGVASIYGNDLPSREDMVGSTIDSNGNEITTDMIAARTFGPPSEPPAVDEHGQPLLDKKPVTNLATRVPAGIAEQNRSSTSERSEKTALEAGAVDTVAVLPSPGRQRGGLDFAPQIKSEPLEPDQVIMAEPPVRAAELSKGPTIIDVEARVIDSRPRDAEAIPLGSPSLEAKTILPDPQEGTIEYKLENQFGISREQAQDTAFQEAFDQAQRELLDNPAIRRPDVMPNGLMDIPRAVFAEAQSAKVRVPDLIARAQVIQAERKASAQKAEQAQAAVKAYFSEGDKAMLKLEQMTELEALQQDPDFQLAFAKVSKDSLIPGITPEEKKQNAFEKTKGMAAQIKTDRETAAAQVKEAEAKRGIPDAVVKLGKQLETFGLDINPYDQAFQAKFQDAVRNQLGSLGKSKGLVTGQEVVINEIDLKGIAQSLVRDYRTEQGLTYEDMKILQKDMSPSELSDREKKTQAYEIQKEKDAKAVAGEVTIATSATPVDAAAKTPEERARLDKRNEQARARRVKRKEGDAYWGGMDESDAVDADVLTRNEDAKTDRTEDGVDDPDGLQADVKSKSTTSGENSGTESVVQTRETQEEETALRIKNALQARPELMSRLVLPDFYQAALDRVEAKGGGVAVEETTQQKVARENADIVKSGLLKVEDFPADERASIQAILDVDQAVSPSIKGENAESTTGDSADAYVRGLQKEGGGLAESETLQQENERLKAENERLKEVLREPAPSKAEEGEEDPELKAKYDALLKKINESGGKDLKSLKELYELGSKNKEKKFLSKEDGQALLWMLLGIVLETAEDIAGDSGAPKG